MPSRTFRLTINDEDLSAWMVMNNAFTANNPAAWNTRKLYWNGVLFQLGGYTSINGPTMYILNSVILKWGNQTVTEVKKAEWEDGNNRIWINIIAGQAAGRPAPMGLQHLDKILPNPPRSLHRYFIPYSGGITFWQDRKLGHSMKASTLGNYHNRYVFSCPKGRNFRVEIYGRRRRFPHRLPWIHVAAPEIYRNVDQVLVTDIGGGDHGDHDNPPQRLP